MSLNEYKKWLAFGTGVGIEIGARDLTVTLARVRPSGAHIRGAMTIERFAERPAGEWGTEYSQFLAAQGASYLAATIVLPRREVIVRQIAMPGVNDKDLAQAVRFQIDGLHPYNEDETVYDFSRIGSSTNVLVGITRRAVVDRYAALFAEAGIKIASLTFSAAVLYGALRMFGTEPAAGFLALDDHEGELEAYGESPARPVFSAAFDTPSPQLAARAVVRGALGAAAARGDGTADVRIDCTGTGGKAGGIRAGSIGDDVCRIARGADLSAVVPAREPAAAGTASDEFAGDVHSDDRPRRTAVVERGGRAPVWSLGRSKVRRGAAR